MNLKDHIEQLHNIYIIEKLLRQYQKLIGSRTQMATKTRPNLSNRIFKATRLFDSDTLLKQF